jgi:hypothetical protein
MSKMVKLADLDSVENIRNVLGSSPTRGTKKMVSLSNWLARRSVKSVPNGLVGSSPTGTTKK